MQGRGILSVDCRVLHLQVPPRVRAALTWTRKKFLQTLFSAHIFGEITAFESPFLSLPSSAFSASYPPSPRANARAKHAQSSVHLQGTISRGETSGSDAKKMECLFMGPHHRKHEDPGDAADQDQLQERPETSVILYNLWLSVEFEK